MSTAKSGLEFLKDRRAPGMLLHPGVTVFFKQLRTKSNSSSTVQSGCASRSMLLNSELDLDWPATLFCYFLVKSLSCCDSVFCIHFAALVLSFRTFH